MCGKCKKCCSRKQTEFSFDAVNAMFDGIHLVNDIDLSIEIYYVCWIWVVIWQRIFPVAPNFDWFSSWRDQLRVCQSTKCADQGAQKFIILQTFSKVQIKVNWYSASGRVLCSLIASFGETADSAPWHPSVKTPTVPVCRRFLVVFKRHWGLSAECRIDFKIRLWVSSTIEIKARNFSATPVFRRSPFRKNPAMPTVRWELRKTFPHYYFQMFKRYQMFETIKDLELLLLLLLAEAGDG